MSVFEHKDGFRPRDQSVATKMKYETEMKHWSDAFKSNQASNRPTNFAADLGVIGLFIGLLFNLLLIVVLSITNLFKWLLGHDSKSIVEKSILDEGVINENLTIEEVDEFLETTKPIKIYDNKKE